MTDKFRIPTAEEKDILRRNHIDPDSSPYDLSVVNRSDDSIILLVHKTGDTIHLRTGNKKWQ